jgi:hypothetical protein
MSVSKRYMVESQIRDELVKQLNRLSLPQQRRVLDYARSLSASASGARGIPGSQLVKFAGTTSPEDCKTMMDAIKAGCERID